MKYKYLALSTGLLLGTLSFQLHAAGITQTITPSEESFTVLPGDTVDFPIIYTADTENSTGVGIQLSFESKKLQFLGFTEKMEQGLIAADNAARKKVKKTEDDDQNDKVVSAAWTNIDGLWPGEGNSPATLGVAHFKVLETDASVTTIDIEGSGAAQSTLVAKDVSVTIEEGNKVAAVNATGGGGGGSLTWWLLPFFLALSLLKRTLLKRKSIS